jgi:hypothetical protein
VELQGLKRQGAVRERRKARKGGKRGKIGKEINIQQKTSIKKPNKRAETNPLKKIKKYHTRPKETG